MKIVLETGKEGLHWILETTEMFPCMSLYLEVTIPLHPLPTHLDNMGNNPFILSSLKMTLLSEAALAGP